MPGAAAATPPELNIPPSKHTVDVSIINTTGHVGDIPVPMFMAPAIPGYDMIQAPCYSFLIKHSSADQSGKYGQLLFDLGVRKDWENRPKGAVDRVKASGYSVKVEKDVAQILRENGDDPAKVGGIIWSHYHWVSSSRMRKPAGRFALPQLACKHRPSHIKTATARSVAEKETRC